MFVPSFPSFVLQSSEKLFYNLPEKGCNINANHSAVQHLGAAAYNGHILLWIHLFRCTAFKIPPISTVRGSNRKVITACQLYLQVHRIKCSFYRQLIRNPETIYYLVISKSSYITFTTIIPWHDTGNQHRYYLHVLGWYSDLRHDPQSPKIAICVTHSNLDKFCNKSAPG